MDDSGKKAFQSYVQQRSPPESKRGTSGVYYEAFGEKIKDRNFRFWNFRFCIIFKYMYYLIALYNNHDSFDQLQFTVTVQ